MSPIDSNGVVLFQTDDMSLKDQTFSFRFYGILSNDPSRKQTVSPIFSVTFRSADVDVNNAPTLPAKLIGDLFVGTAVEINLGTPVDADGDNVRIKSYFIEPEILGSTWIRV